MNCRAPQFSWDRERDRLAKKENKVTAAFECGCLVFFSAVLVLNVNKCVHARNEKCCD